MANWEKLGKNSAPPLIYAGPLANGLVALPFVFGYGIHIDMATQAQDLGRMLRLQREIMLLSPENRRELLASLSGEEAQREKGDGANHQAFSTPSSVATKPKGKTKRRSKGKALRLKVSNTPDGAKPSTGRKSVAGSVPDITLGVVENASQKLGAAAVLQLVRAAKPDVRPVGVYQALHTGAEDGKIGKEMVGNKALYFKLPGGKKK